MLVRVEWTAVTERAGLLAFVLCGMEEGAAGAPFVRRRWGCIARWRLCSIDLECCISLPSMSIEAAAVSLHLITPS